MTRTLRVVLILSAIAVAACAVCYWAIRTSVSQRVPLPDPNGYEDFVAAGRMLNGVMQLASVDLKQATIEQLRPIVLSDRTGVERLRLGLGRDCRVPIQNSSAYMERHVNELAEIKEAATALQVEGRLAELENRPADAAASYLAEMKLSINVSRGGLLIDLLVSIACEARTVNTLESALHIFNASQLRQLARQLEELDREWEPFAQVIARENSWGRNTMPFQYLVYKATYALRSIVTRRSSDPLAATRNSVRAKYQAQVRRTQQLEADLAARAYELEKGHAPAGWNDLVPAYLPRIPADPDTQSNLNYSFGPMQNR